MIRIDRKIIKRNETSGGRHPAMRHSRRFSNELVEDARTVLRDETGRDHSAEEARQMLENLTGLFTVLYLWDRRMAELKPLREEFSDGSE
jgi:hypothetical protein